jgi:hypothetical protein
MVSSGRKKMVEGKDQIIPWSNIAHNYYSTYLCPELKIKALKDEKLKVIKAWNQSKCIICNIKTIKLGRYYLNYKNDRKFHL